MPDETYNGWTNRATWLMSMYLDGNYDGESTHRDTRMHVELARDIDSESRVSRLADSLRDYVSDRIGELDGIVSDLLGYALGDVDWVEIATNLLAES